MVSDLENLPFSLERKTEMTCDNLHRSLVGAALRVTILAHAEDMLRAEEDEGSSESGYADLGRLPRGGQGGQQWNKR